MNQSAACQPWHEDYSFIGWIPTGISFAVIQIRAGRAAVGAAERDRPFAEDFPATSSPVDFR
jgi:hypothetical protein